MMDVILFAALLSLGLGGLIALVIYLFVVKPDQDIKIHDEDSINREDFDDVDWKVIKDIAKELMK